MALRTSLERHFDYGLALESEFSVAFIFLWLLRRRVKILVSVLIEASPDNKHALAGLGHGLGLADESGSIIPAAFSICIHFQDFIVITKMIEIAVASY